MEAWWAANGKTLTDQLRPSHPFLQKEQEYLEELTGKMPILLRALAAVKVKYPSTGANIAMNVDASSNISDIPARLMLHPKYLEYVAKLEEEYVRMTERTQRV